MNFDIDITGPSDHIDCLDHTCRSQGDCYDASDIFPPFDRQSGRVFGILKAELEKRGIGCSEPDLRIAAVAMQHSFAPITGNTQHFKNIPGLRIENWIA